MIDPYELDPVAVEAAMRASHANAHEDAIRTVIAAYLNHRLQDDEAMTRMRGKLPREAFIAAVRGDARVCERCNGSGSGPGLCRAICKYCGGTGKWGGEAHDAPPWDDLPAGPENPEKRGGERVCERCSGTGRTPNYLDPDNDGFMDCPVCNGTGKQGGEA